MFKCHVMTCLMLIVGPDIDSSRFCLKLKRNMLTVFTLTFQLTSRTFKPGLTILTKNIKSQTSKRSSPIPSRCDFKATTHCEREETQMSSYVLLCTRLRDVIKTGAFSIERKMTSREAGRVNKQTNTSGARVNAY